ncbi:MAG: DUF72 domain-containing protein [Firmicutes bacterium]|nr:DUF72 domain-containing protein [Bacillota bacterium]
MGTAGFSYADWRGTFYPEGAREAEFLGYYSRFFNVVELDFTYYRMPTPKTMKGLCDRTPPGFEFCVKANKAMTHEPPADGEALGETFRAFVDSLEPMVSAGKLGCVLAQFPFSFKPSSESLDYLAGFKEMCRGLPLVVEYRNSSWVTESTFEFLKAAGIGFCCVDEPRLRGLMPRVAVTTSRTAYVRFHGRNAAKWWNHEHASERYDYLYSKEELEEWVPKIVSIDQASDKTYVLFNNCHGGKAARNSLMMKELLGLGPPVPAGTLPGLDEGGLG